MVTGDGTVLKQRNYRNQKNRQGEESVNIDTQRSRNAQNDINSNRTRNATSQGTGEVKFRRGQKFSFVRPKGASCRQSLRHDRQFRHKLDTLNFWCKEMIHENSMSEIEKEEKESFLRWLRKALKDIEPNIEAEKFGSVASGFALKDSDLDVAVYLKNENSIFQSAQQLPQLVNEVVRARGYRSKLILKTRVPLVKIFGLEILNGEHPFDCDISFTNRLGIHNSRLLKTYSKCDPRVRMVALFIKYWSKRRKINSPCDGTLSSYGYILLVLHYMLNVANPQIIPNLQLSNFDGNIPLDYMECNGYSIYFRPTPFQMSPPNTSSVGEIIYGIFRYYAFFFDFRNDVVSIRTPGGLLEKKEKKWDKSTEIDDEQGNTIRNRYFIAIEDPFETTHNVGRTVQGRCWQIIKTEFVRAAKLIEKSIKDPMTLHELFEEAPKRKSTQRYRRNSDDEQNPDEHEEADDEQSPNEHEHEVDDEHEHEIDDDFDQGGRHQAFGDQENGFEEKHSKDNRDKYRSKSDYERGSIKKTNNEIINDVIKMLMNSNVSQES